MAELRQLAAAVLLPGFSGTTVAAPVVTVCAARPDTVHVDTGVPGPGLGAGARIDTYGGSMVCLRAAAELIAATIADTRKATRHV